MVSFRDSLWMRFIVISLSVFIALAGLFFFTYAKLNENKSLVSEVLNSSIPETVRAFDVYSSVKELRFLIDKMVESKNKALRRIAYKKALKDIEIISRYDMLQNKDHFLKLRQQIQDIVKMVSEDIRYENEIKFVKYSFYRANTNLMSKNTAVVSDLNNMLLFFDISTIDDVKSLDKKLDGKISFLVNISQEDKKLLLDSKNNLIRLYKKRLKSKSELKIKSIFVHNLVNTFADEIRYVSVKHNQLLIDKVDETSKRLHVHSKIILGLFWALLIYLVFVGWYFKRKLFTRLVLLNDFIAKKIEGTQDILVDNGKDEISYIVKSFGFFAKKLEKLSFVDGLTGIANKRLFKRKFAHELSLVKRLNGVSSCLMIDIDDFKLFNDNYGHVEGDKCLAKVATAIGIVLKRDIDLVARYGGEEFVCILSGTDEEGAKEVAKDILTSVENLKIQHQFHACSPYVTISIGIQTFRSLQCDNAQQIISEADSALYVAKGCGKNKFVHYCDTDI